MGQQGSLRSRSLIPPSTVEPSDKVAIRQMSGRESVRKFCRVNCPDSDRMNKIDRMIIRFPLSFIL